ncbi:glucose-1-phosphate cytidylyltransferase [Candidatus Pelagibacter sp.]|nr:glucose-1-phosphate cytidylyltransferase [Candidatus Pelagibacter sp.]
MKLVILAGGYGTRINEENSIIPKPLIEIGNKPIIWHIMKMYSFYGIKEFIICCGYKGNMIKDYFINYSYLNSDLEVDLSKNSVKILNNQKDDWKITLVDTGIKTLTGGRIKQIYKYIKNDKFFCLTYGDGLSDINIKKLIQHHVKHKRLVTVTAASVPGRFGNIEIGHNNNVKNFSEKKSSKITKDRINGGFMVIDPSAVKLIKNNQSNFESDTLTLLSKKKQISAFIHDGFWQCMDTPREKILLEDLWRGNAPWKKW